MTNRERENATLSFEKPDGRGSAEETFWPWHKSLTRWAQEGAPEELTRKVYEKYYKYAGREEWQFYLNTTLADGAYEFEKFLGLDGVIRILFEPPFRNFDVHTYDETDEYIIRQDCDGWQRKYYKDRNLHEDLSPLVSCEADWKRVKDNAFREIEKYYNNEKINRALSCYIDGHLRGDYSVRIALHGFFWFARPLMGVENHLLAFYDYPEMLHDMNEFLLQLYLDRLGKTLDILKADIVYLMEDLSGSNGPMISPGLFDEFVGSYYKRLIPFLKQKGVKHVLVDTDGDFNILLPNFINAGVEGFLPMDVNAGMDIVGVRKKYPGLKFIGAFNKLEIARGKDAIDREFERLLPVIRQGGYIPGCDHQVAPSTSFENYLYYISRLKEVLKECGTI